MGPGKFLENSRNSTGKVLEKSLRFVTKKGMNPVLQLFNGLPLLCSLALVVTILLHV